VLAIGWWMRRRVRSSEDFLTSHRSVPLWITSLAFLAANLGAQEVVGMCASGAKYGIMTAHFYWVGAVPAMLFVGVFMMPFYYGSRARSVPEYLKLRFDEKTRALNAVSFAVMTVSRRASRCMHWASCSNWCWAGISQRACCFRRPSCWSTRSSADSPARSTTRCCKFFLIVLGFAPLAILAVDRAGGWKGLSERCPQ
jgi:SSS family solute:Na+ symporter